MTSTLDMGISLDTLRDTILRALEGVERIVLFGSRATGSYRSDSDVDLLVIADSALPAEERAVALRMALRGLGIGFDLIVLTPQEVEQHSAWQSSVVARALNEGVVIHEAA